MIPLKVIGPPCTMVIVPVAKRVMSALGVATMVRFAAVQVVPEAGAGVHAVGTLDGAV